MTNFNRKRNMSDLEVHSMIQLTPRTETLLVNQHIMINVLLDIRDILLDIKPTRTRRGAVRDDEPPLL